MKSHNYICLAAAIALFGACSNDEDEIRPIVEDNNSAHTAVLRLDGGIQHFDDDVTSGGSAATRAATSDWDDGAKLYIQYQTNNGTVKGVATYNESTNEWTVNYYGSIVRNETKACEVYFFENTGAIVNEMVPLTCNSAVFLDKEATYLYKDGIVHLKTHLMPQTGRVRFRGTPGYEFLLSGLKYYNKYDFASNTLSIDNEAFSLTVGDDGYTPYIYATFEDESNRELTVNNQDDEAVYNSYFDDTILAIGKSGYMNVPTMDAYNGWFATSRAPFCPDSHHPHVIDLGDAGKWACCNIGARFPIDLGERYAWGETKTKETFSWNNYIFYDDSSKKMTKYCIDSYYGIVDNKTTLEPSDDAAQTNWGNSWRMPSGNELSKLCYCSKQKITILGVEGAKITASNGNSIFLPKSSYWSSSLYYDAPKHQHSNNADCADALFFNNNFDEDFPMQGYIDTSQSWNMYYGGKYYYRSEGLCIRPISE